MADVRVNPEKHVLQDVVDLAGRQPAPDVGAEPLPEDLPRITCDAVEHGRQQQDDAFGAVPQQPSPAGRIARMAADATKFSAPESGLQFLIRVRLASSISI